MEAGLNGATLFFTMHERRVMRLAECRMPMWLYFGSSDPDRAFAEELPKDDVVSWLMMVLKGADRDDFRVVAPFDCKNPRNLVRIPLLIAVLSRMCGALPDGSWLLCFCRDSATHALVLVFPEAQKDRLGKLPSKRPHGRRRGRRAIKAVKRETKEREVSCRAQHVEDPNRIWEEFPFTSEIESAPSSGSGGDSEETWSGMLCSSTAGVIGDVRPHDASSSTPHDACESVASPDDSGARKHAANDAAE
ncbi:hypothetical protein C2845_PM13G10200 [Panicum miliaceum]|uniref:Uncharacterized protein n=1 Tax=Panicum miliaceum TaxID=4540 RepID=A0A3L6RI11_PANMI|nr:hypothetical protein C2845_PM13G10200 [Panicum miliaceum]